MLKNNVLSITYCFYVKNIGEGTIFLEERLEYLKNHQMSQDLTNNVIEFTFVWNIRIS